MKMIDHAEMIVAELVAVRTLSAYEPLYQPGDADQPRVLDERGYLGEDPSAPHTRLLRFRDRLGVDPSVGQGHGLDFRRVPVSLRSRSRAHRCWLSSTYMLALEHIDAHSRAQRCLFSCMCTGAAFSVQCSNHSSYADHSNHVQGKQCVTHLVIAALCTGPPLWGTSALRTLSCRQHCAFGHQRSASRVL